MEKFSNRINESIDELSEDKVKELISMTKEGSNSLLEQRKMIDNMIEDLNPFISKSDKNDQIDDAYIKLKEINSLISESITKLGDIDSKMNDYLKSGRSYLY